MRAAFRVILGLCLLLCAGAALAQKGHSSPHSSHSSHVSGSHSSSPTSHSHSSSSGSVYVHGYTRKDGTYVSPHYRSVPGTASPSVGGGYRPIEISGAGRSDLSEFAATHHFNAPTTAATAARPSASSAGSGNSIAWSRPRSGTNSGNASYGGTHASGTTYPKIKASHTTTVVGTTGHHSKAYCSTCFRDSHGKIARSEKAKEDFMRRTGHPHGWSGHVVDHIRPLACGGRDELSNMQWQTVDAARFKDKTERKGCS
jgi:hypothetical protein